MTDGCSDLDVVVEPDNLLVLFRWRRDPNVYAVEVALPATPTSPWTGLPVTSVYEWAADVMAGLSENLATGLVLRSRRKVRDGYVVLDARDLVDVCPAGYFIESVPLVGAPSSWRPSFSWPWRNRTHVTWGPPEEPVPLPVSKVGSWLARAGMDVSLPRQLIAETRLACWLQAYVDNDRGEPYVGHTAVSWEDTRCTTARLHLVHIKPGVLSEVRGALVRSAVRMVTENGALHVVTAIDVPELHRLGFRPANEGGLTLRTSDADPPGRPHPL
ncbi:hypothetical protein GCM10010140_18040 [Streptosporangium pseudovulgare]|uniref:Uncharacterized protein n=2 Tax=Streptosporangium pseudovulgare TaxID=35765 RepID=A0ABQ2QMS2_9ACTN|nr:hypothetical protein GCM10010140_18040 [Streptosporangium pseudovulgare]